MFKTEPLSFDFLCGRLKELETDIKDIENQFLFSRGSHYLFTKLQKLTEEYDQLDRLIAAIYKMDKRAIKKLAA